MTPQQSFNLVDRLTKSLAIIDEKGRSLETYASYALWKEDWKSLRQFIYLSLEVVKRIEVNVD